MTIGEGTINTLVAIGITVPLFLLWIVAYVDLARRRDLAITKKALWAAAMFFGVYIGIAAYAVMRPVPEVIGKGLNPTTPETSAIVSNLETLRENHSEGSMTDADYLTKKRELLGLV